MKVRITPLHENIDMPAYQTPGSAGFDLAPCEDAIIAPKEHKLLPTGMIIAVPTGYVLLIVPRSSMFKKTGLLMPHSMGVIDSDYRGPGDQVMLYVYNPSDTPVAITAGQRLAQGLILPCAQVEFEKGPVLTDSTRGGFGSTS